MILLDTGVLIDFFRGKDKKLPPLFASHPLAVCGVVRAEIVAGHRSAKQRADEIAGLDRLHQVPTPDVLWDRLGDNLAALRTSGVTVPCPDALLATVAIEAGLELWTRDHHFALVQAVLPALQLFAEPP